jgi:hypothetical protein
MSTPAQKEFLADHIDHLLEQTHTAEDAAVDILQQVTARRLHRMLIAARIQVEELPEDGSTTSAWKTATGVALLEALGFEEPSDG